MTKKTGRPTGHPRGLPLTAEHRAAIGRAGRGRILTAAHRRAVSLAQKGVPERHLGDCHCFRCHPLSRTKHGHAALRTPEYVAWQNMLARCTREAHPKYPSYGGRGIKVCAEWLFFENFLADMGLRPDGLTLDRIDNDGNYCKENCKWATWKEQAHNRRPRKKRGAA